MPTLPIIKRAGIFSKARVCHWCHQRRWTGWWVRLPGKRFFRPACSHHASKFWGSVGEGMVIKRKT